LRAACLRSVGAAKTNQTTKRRRSMRPLTEHRPPRTFQKLSQKNDRFALRKAHREGTNQAEHVRVFPKGLTAASQSWTSSASGVIRIVINRGTDIPHETCENLRKAAGRRIELLYFPWILKTEGRETSSYRGRENVHPQAAQAGL